MWAKVESNTITELIHRPKSLTIGDVQYPHNIFGLWSVSELEAIGIYEVTIDYTNLKDKEYYQNTDITYAYASGAVTGSYGTATAKPLADLKTLKKETTNRQANSLLQAYDWYTLREASGGTAIPSAITTYQAAVRTAANSMCTKIDAVSDVDALAALYTYNSDDPPVRPIGEWPSEPS
tara:strand:- start:79 stop:615 length:537 start_codon:yes stop_codon:yes gene_type:complete